MFFVYFFLLGFAAVFKEKLDDTSFLIGGTIILRCKVQGNPFLRTCWYRNDEFIIEDDRIQLTQGKDCLCTLTIYALLEYLLFSLRF
jgi:hypothetical protein